MDKVWIAHWIWAQEMREKNNIYVEARRSFHLEDEIGHAALHISANQMYRLYVNGQEVGFGPAPADQDWKSYDTYDMTSLLVRGENTIAVLIYNFGEAPIVTDQMQGPGGLIVQVDGQLRGSTEPWQLGTDEQWKCRQSPRWKSDSSRLHAWRGYRELYLAAQEDGWEQQGYEDQHWLPATIVASPGQEDSPWPRLLSREIPHLRQKWIAPQAIVDVAPYYGQIDGLEHLLVDQPQPVAPAQAGGAAVISASVPGSYPQVTFDFSREVVGYTEVELIAPEGGVLQLFYGESLEMELTQTFILKPGLNVLRPFTRSAFRYMKLGVQATPQPLQIHRIGLRSVGYPFMEHGQFTSDDARLNQIWEVGKYTTQINTHDHFEDCPYREQAMWVADAVVMAKVVYQTFGDSTIVRKSLLQSARIQTAEGAIPGTGPERNHFLLPDFCAHWLFGVYEYWQYSGDRAFVQEVWPNILKLAEWFRQQEDADGLFSKADREGWWCFIDWSNDIDRRDRVTAVSCFYYKFLREAAALADLIGETDMQQQWLKRAESLRTAIRRLLRAPGQTLFADCLTEEGLSGSLTAQTNFAAAWSGIMDDAEVRIFLESYYLPGKLPPIRGSFFYHVVLETLFRYNFVNEAMQEIRSFWGAMLDRGATTWWETFDPSLPLCTVPGPYQGHTPTYLQDAIPVSYSHGWGATPTYLLISGMLGLDVRSLATEGVKLQPYAVSDLDEVTAVVPTPSGDVSASWSRSKTDGRVLYEAYLPEQLAWTTEGLEEVSSDLQEGRRRISGIVSRCAIAVT